MAASLMKSTVKSKFNIGMVDLSRFITCMLDLVMALASSFEKRIMSISKQYCFCL